MAQAELDRSRELAEELETRLQLERERLQVLESSVDEQITAQQAQVRRLEAIVQFNTERLASLEVSAGVSGVLAELPVQEGEWVQPRSRSPVGLGPSREIRPRAAGTSEPGSGVGRSRA